MKERCAFISELSLLIECKYQGEDIAINGLNLCNRETIFESVLSYSTSELFLDAVISNQRIKSLIVTTELCEYIQSSDNDYLKKLTYIISEEPEIAFYSLHNKLVNGKVFYGKPINKKIGNNCSIHPSAIIEDGVILHDNVIVGPNTVIRAGTEIGDDTYIGCCNVIGEDGFQAISGFKGHIFHTGGVSIGKGVTIGNNNTICKSLFEGKTLIGDYCKIDSLILVSHNCICGNNVTLCPGVILMGSTTIKDNAYLAPGAMVLNQKIVGENAFVASMSYVNKTVKPGTQVFGIPAKRIDLIK